MNLFLFVVKNAYYSFFRWVEDVGKINMSTKWEELQGKLLKNDQIIVELEV